MPLSHIKLLKGNIVTSHHATESDIIRLVCTVDLSRSVGLSMLDDKTLYSANNLVAIVVQDTDCFGTLY